METFVFMEGFVPHLLIDILSFRLAHRHAVRSGELFHYREGTEASDWLTQGAQWKMGKCHMFERCKTHALVKQVKKNGRVFQIYLRSQVHHD